MAKKSMKRSGGAKKMTAGAGGGKGRMQKAKMTGMQTGGMVRSPTRAMAPRARAPMARMKCGGMVKGKRKG